MYVLNNLRLYLCLFCVAWLFYMKYIEFSQINRIYSIYHVYLMLKKVRIFYYFALMTPTIATEGFSITLTPSILGKSRTRIA